MRHSQVYSWSALAVGAAVLALLSAGCGDRCTINGCEDGLVCSPATDQCISPESAYGPLCPEGPEQCHLGICLTVEADMTPVCTGTCSPGDPPCPDRWTCAPVGDGWGGTVDVCVPSGGGALGDPCERSSDCVSAFCLTLTTGSFCSAECDVDVPGSCGTANAACLQFEDTGGNLWDFCVAGGESGPGQGCPDGVMDCDFTSTDICLSNEDNSVNFCTLACPDGDGCAEAIPGGCCADIGGQGLTDDFYCLPAQMCGCQPQCLGRECGDDGCGGSCGACTGTDSCVDGSCVPCTPVCDGAECGDDGCGGACGTCAAGELCRAGLCERTCTPDCTGRQCGDDGCGGLCGACTSPERCHAGQCLPPTVLLRDVLVRDPALDPAALWGLGEFTGPPSIAPPLTYLQGPQDGSSQTLTCGATLLCSEVPDLAADRPYELVLGYEIDGVRSTCTVGFQSAADGAATVDAAACTAEGGGPFQGVTVSGGPARPVFGWTVP